jgi:hypothetical protein
MEPMKYFHRTHESPDAILALAREFFGSRLTPVQEEARRLTFSGSIGRVSVTVQAEGGHYTLVTMATDQVGESEADKLAKRFLTVAHTAAHPTHRPIGAY